MCLFINLDKKSSILTIRELKEATRPSQQHHVRVIRRGYVTSYTAILSVQFFGEGGAASITTERTDRTDSRGVRKVCVELINYYTHHSIEALSGEDFRCLMNGLVTNKNLGYDLSGAERPLSPFCLERYALEE